MTSPEPSPAALRKRAQRAREAVAEGRTIRKPGRPRGEHGSPSCYAAGCRETPCKTAHAERMAAYRAARR